LKRLNNLVTQRTHICLSIDTLFVIQAMVTAYSVIRNAKEKEKLFFHIIVENKNKPNYKKLIKFINSFGCEGRLYEVRFPNENIFKTTHHVTKAVYNRLFLSEVLKIDKVLYLDSDLIVQKDISELYNVEIEDVQIAAVNEDLGDLHLKRLGLTMETNYINSGVMLINLEKWRADNLTIKFLQFLRDFNDKILWWDQDVINAVVTKRQILSLDWNVTETHWNAHFEKEEGISHHKNIAILHFTGSPKPWNGGKHQLSYIYFEYVLEIIMISKIFKRMIQLKIFQSFMSLLWKKRFCLKFNYYVALLNIFLIRFDRDKLTQILLMFKRK
jgi:lipopolysaccharide biosynthesis glycosyltransferase